MAFFYETPEDKFEAETISLEYIFFQIFVWGWIIISMGQKAQCRMEKG
jgi:hypothetical protein